MIKITNSNQDTEITVKTEAAVKRILRKIVKHYGGRKSLKGIYIHHPKAGTFYAENMEL